MQLWVAISSLILLLTDAVVSYVQVNGVVGHPATLPCTYSTASGVTTMCWGRGACPISHCLEEIVWTNGSHVTFQKHLRYKLKGKLSEGDVSLTIENAAQTDSGQYCCRVEHRGWFNDMKLTLSLEIKPDGNGTVTQSSDGLWHNNQTHVSLAQNSWMTTSKGLYIGICITAVVLLTVLVVVITKKYLCIRNKLEQLNMVSLNDSQTGALQSAAEVGVQAEDNIYIIEDNLYVMD
ncbi:hepatitis A virus cellular receptor 1 precursor [Canis lupus familiaris]|uniref:Hepatitis A virus cellular receptor 1 n=3 Tax=Canis lupus TaxID=9612 RepID=A0A8C0N5Y0_CANLF|nr:hepatitis A virus cellular receptor 1 precursor [Canis lupus familiaris]ADZ24775.1 hepatitis A virus cellular receptor 1d [Canis lupus familiaris]|eukprot:NP_001192043.1 hepatitis A virus cellular receptor 1 precursor [Canis lupus familiaris]